MRLHAPLAAIFNTRIALLLCYRTEEPHTTYMYEHLASVYVFSCLSDVPSLLLVQLVLCCICAGQMFVSCQMLETVPEKKYT